MGYIRSYRARGRMASRPRCQHQESWKSVPCPSSVSPSETRWRSVRHWEEQFGMKWRRFLTSKTDGLPVYNVTVWDDSAAKESFFDAERRFWSTNCLSNASLPSSDLFIDNVDWDSRIDSRLLMEFEAVRQDRKRVEPAIQIADSMPWTTEWEDIKPTGWDVCGDDWSKPVVLTGRIVGGGGGHGYENINLHGDDEDAEPMRYKQPREIFDQGGNCKSLNFTAEKPRHQGNHRGRWGFDNYMAESKNFRENNNPGAGLIV